MKRENLKQLLLKHYSVAGVNMILRGERKPSYEVMFQLSEKNNVPFTAWKDITSFISNDTKSVELAQI
nr:hypothetical protein [Malaciobacter halophilus]